jgi:peptidyl-prolyl cis-trans isomerase A (cyclophilin A)
MMNKFAQFFLTILLLASVHLQASAAEPVKILMQTSAGDITFELFPDRAPITVSNFLRYVDGNHYRGAKFYRVVRMDNQAQNKIKIEVIQGGLAELADDAPFKSIAHETTEDTGIRHTDGVISMARLEPGSASSEFFICINAQPELDYGGMRNPDGQGFAAFGKVIEGMELVRKIQHMKTDTPPEAELEYTSGQILVNPIVISKMLRIPVNTENQ